MLKLVNGLWFIVNSKSKKTIHHKPSTINQLGFIPIALLLFLVASVALGTYLVQNRTNILPHAEEICDENGENCEPVECEEERLDNECREGEVYEIYRDCNGDYRREGTGESCGEESCDEERLDNECRDGKVYEIYRDCNGDYRRENTGENCGEGGQDNSKEECEAEGGTWDGDECKTPQNSEDNYDDAGCRGNHSVWANWNKKGQLLRVIEDYGVVPGECGNPSDSGGSSDPGGSTGGVVPGESSSCPVSSANGGVSSACASCIKGNHSDLVGSLKDQGTGRYESCSDRQILNDWCGGGVAGAEGDCAKKKSECSSVCIGGSTNPDNDSSSIQACKDNPDGVTKPAGYTWIAFCSKSCSTNEQCKGLVKVSGFVNPETAYWCYGGKCLNLVTDNDSQVKDSKRLEDNKKAIEAGARIINNAPGTSLATDEKDLKQYAIEIDKDLAEAKAKGAVPPELQQAADKAKQLIATAQAEITKCQASSNVQACEASVHELYNQAKVASRLEAYYVVQAGIPNRCSKIDFGIQPLITDGTGNRQFLCNDSTGKKVLRAYDTAGNPTVINAGFDLNNVNSYPENIKKHITDAEKLTLGRVVTNLTGSSSACTIGKQSPSLSSNCVSCIKNKHSDLVSSVRNGEVTKFQACSDNEVLNYWCNGGVSSGASSDCTIKRGECSSECRATEPSTSSAGTFTTVSAAKDACKKLVNTKWNDSTNKCQVDCGTGSNNIWYNGACRGSCPANTDSENVSGIGKYCTTQGVYPFPVYQP